MTVCLECPDDCPWATSRACDTSLRHDDIKQLMDSFRAAVAAVMPHPHLHGFLVEYLTSVIEALASLNPDVG